jgi:Ca2+-transporting ATPase
MNQTDLPPYRLNPHDVLEAFKSRKSGLSGDEATQRLLTDGNNFLGGLKTESLALKYLRQFKDTMILLLLVSAVISFFLGDQRISIVLVVLVIFNTLIGFFQEFRAEKTMQALEKLVKPEAEVIRDGTLQTIESLNLVPGDIVHISEGDSVPADLRLIEETSLSTNDFALTGESQPTRKFLHAISKDIPTPSRHNLVFMGTTVATGEGFGVVIATGLHTELGRIASLSQVTPHELSPLQRELKHIGLRVTIGVIFLCAILMLVAVSSHLALQAAFLFAVGFASSLIPQGLPAEINTSLAQAAGKLSRAKALVKKLSAVETLGATHIICTDKTGTLTKNEMTVQELIIGRTAYLVSGTGYEANGVVTSPHGTPLSKALLAHQEHFFATGVLASNARILPPDENHQGWYCLGDPTEGALITLARKAGLNIDKFNVTYPEIRELPFDSARKRMTSLRELHNHKAIAYVKGAPESILERATHIFDGTTTRPLTAQDREWFINEHESRAKQALRNLAFAMRTVPLDRAKTMSIDEIESDLTLLGMVSMLDPLREAVPAAMTAARRAHIKVNIITGDFALTAEAIARKAGLVAPGESLIVVTGEELLDITDEALLKIIMKGGIIFSRVSPEDKMRIVELIKKTGLVVAVTGDGINDAPALKRADIGVAMGITGTDVAKQSAEIILLDDSFATLVKAIQAGRTIFANIKKATLSCFTSNSAELVVNLCSLGATTILGIPLGIGIMQLLSIDLIAELFPIAALGWDKEEGELMKQKPRDPRAHILNLPAIIDLLWCGLIIGGLAYANYLLFYARAGIDAATVSSSSQVYFAATTMTYLTVVICQLVNIIQRRSVHGFFSAYQFNNRYFWGAIGLSLVCVMAIVYQPFVNQYFKSAPISPRDWLYVIGAAIIFLTIRELGRLIFSRTSQPDTPKTNAKNRVATAK